MSAIVFLDIDGTIRDFDGTIPDSALRGIRQIQENGHLAVICSGRPHCHIDKRLRKLDFDGIISAAGSYVEYKGKLLAKEVFPKVSLTLLTQDLLKHHCIMEYMNAESYYILQEQKERYEKLQAELHGEEDKNAKTNPKHPRFVDTIEETGEIEKMTYFSDEMSHEYLRERWGDVAYFVPHSIPHPFHYGGEMSVCGVNKGTGVEKILKACGMNKTQAIAIGDSENDLDMFRCVGTKVAMGNASPMVKEAADLVSAPLKEDGLWKAFQMLGIL